MNSPVLAVLAQTPSRYWESIGEQYRASRSTTATFIAVGAIILGVLFVYWLARRQARRASEAGRGNPQGLFRETLARLPLTPPQRTLLRRIAGASALEHPAALLLSRPLFERHASNWVRARGQGDNAKQVAAIKSVERVLFPALDDAHSAGDRDTMTQH